MLRCSQPESPKTRPRLTTDSFLQEMHCAYAPKKNMHGSWYGQSLTSVDVKFITKGYGVLLDLHLRVSSKGKTSDQLSENAIGLNCSTMFELYCRSLGITPTVNLFRVSYKLSKQVHWFSFEKRVGKGVGGKIFRETFSGMKGWKDKFFSVDRRAILDVMA
ncbi:hypothetical protein Tco_0929867 [Tanacetum coccineum]